MLSISLILFYLFLYFDNEHIPDKEIFTLKVNGSDKLGNILGKKLVKNTVITLSLVTDNTIPNIKKIKLKIIMINYSLILVIQNMELINFTYTIKEYKF